MSFVLYSYPDCASVVVRMVLEELGLAYRDEVVCMHEGAHQSEEYLRINPRGLVPALAEERSGLVICETGAILSFLAEHTGLLSPSVSDKSGRALFLQMLFFLSNTLHADAQLQYYTERYVGDEFVDKARPKIHARMRQHFELLERLTAANGGRWLLGADLTVCDFYLAGCVRWALIAPRTAPLEAEAVTKLPFLNRLLQQLESRESVQRAFDKEDTPRSAYFRSPVRSDWTRDKDQLPWSVA